MQRFRMAGGLVAGILAVANAPSSQGGNSDPIPVTQVKTEKTAKFQGQWMVVSATVDGDEQDMKGDKVRLAKGEFLLEEHNGEEQEGTYKVDTSKKPIHIDFTPKQGRDKDKVFKGFSYSRKRGSRFAWPARATDRPTEASSKEGSGHILVVLEPAKSEP